MPCRVRAGVAVEAAFFLVRKYKSGGAGDVRLLTATPPSQPPGNEPGHGGPGRSRPPDAERHCDHSPCVTVVTSRPASPGSRPLAALPPQSRLIAPITADTAVPGRLSPTAASDMLAYKGTGLRPAGEATTYPKGGRAGKEKRKTEPFPFWTSVPAAEKERQLQM